jgi:hypothetical protein
MQRIQQTLKEKGLGRRLGSRRDEQKKPTPPVIAGVVQVREKSNKKRAQKSLNSTVKGIYHWITTKNRLLRPAPEFCHRKHFQVPPLIELPEMSHKPGLNCTHL